MTKLKPQACHYYEPDIEDFDGCPVITDDAWESLRILRQKGSICFECHHYKDAPSAEPKRKRWGNCPEGCDSETDTFFSC